MKRIIVLFLCFGVNYCNAMHDHKVPEALKGNFIDFKIQAYSEIHEEFLKFYSKEKSISAMGFHYNTQLVHSKILESKNALECINNCHKFLLSEDLRYIAIDPAGPKALYFMLKVYNHYYMMHTFVEEQAYPFQKIKEVLKNLSERELPDYYSSNEDIWSYFTLIKEVSGYYNSPEHDDIRETSNVKLIELQETLKKKYLTKVI